MTLATYIEEARNTWCDAREALVTHLRAHRDQRAWHPQGTPERAAADLRESRRLRELEAEEVDARAILASRLRRSGYRPLPSGLYEAIG